MATNIYRVTAAMASQILPLRGDMAATLDFVPPDGYYFQFDIDEAGSYVISSNSAPIRGFDGVKRPTLTISGDIGIFAKVRYDKTQQCWKVSGTNIVGNGSGEGGGGAGTPGAAATIQIGTVTSGQTAQVTNSGTPNAAVLDIVLPKGDKGDPGTDGVDGVNAVVPPGGNTGDVLTKAGTADGAVTWAPPPAGSGGGTGTGSSPERAISADSSGNLIITKALGLNYRCKLTADIALLVDPTGFVAGDFVRIVFEQDSVGNRKINRYGTAYAFADAQPPVLPPNPGALGLMEMYLSAGGEWIARVYPDKTVTAGFGKISPLAKIGTNTYYSMAEAAGQLADAQTLIVTRNGRGSESTATFIDNETVVITGQAMSDGSRPKLLTFPDTRLSFQKAIINVEGGNVLIRDLILSGARNIDSTARGIGLNNANLSVRNVRVEDCENGILWGVISQDILIEDSEFDNNGQSGINGNGGEQGYTHNLYAGEGTGILRVRRSSFINSRYGHDFKTRQDHTIIERCLFRGALAARELDCPNGGILEVSDSIFHKNSSNAAQGNLLSIGQEGIKAGRTRSYVFRNCDFINDIPAIGRDVTFVWNGDPDVDVILIDCRFIGAGGLANNSAMGTGLTTVRGLRGRVIEQYTNGPLGPRYPVGYQPQIIGA